MSENPFQIVGMVVGCQVMAPVWFFEQQLPRFGKIKVLNTVIHPAHPGGRVQANTLHPFYYDSPPLPERTSIEFLDHRGSHYYMVIGHDDLRVDSNDGGLFSANYGGSGEIGLALIGLPGLLVTSPLLIANGLAWTALEKAVGMNRWAWTIWMRMKDQLDEPTRKLVKEAFQRMYEKGA